MRFALAVLIFGVAVLAVCTIGRFVSPGRAKVQSFNGTTWVDDVCYVKEDVLWCTASG